MAFTWLEAEQSEPNLSLAAGIVREGCHLLHGGYLGDIVTSPFIAYAVEVTNRRPSTSRGGRAAPPRHNDKGSHWLTV